MEHARTAFDFVIERFSAASQPEPRVIAVVGALAVLITVVPQSWRTVRQASTIIHEMGHVLAAWFSGRRVSGIKLHSDTSGVTVSRGKPRGPGMLITALAGYPAPGLLGVGLVALAAAGYAGAALTLYQLVLVVALLLSRNVFGIISCLASVLATGAIWWFNDPALVTHTVVGLGIFYALAGVRGTLDLWAVHFAVLRPRSSPATRARSKQRAASTDASRAAQAWAALALPAPLWLMLLLLVSLGSATAVFWMMFA